MSDLRLRVSQLAHTYGSRPALADVDLEAGLGITVVLGPNGAGKSSLFKLIADTLPLQRGTIEVLGVSRESRRAVVGYLPQDPKLFGDFTCAEFVAYCAWTQGARARASLQFALASLEKVGLGERQDDRVSSLSGGMRRRLSIACAIAVARPVVLLDEPMAGLDPAQRIEVRELVNLIATEAIVLVSTHVLQDVPDMASQIVLLNEGRIIFHGSKWEFLGRPNPDPDGVQPEVGPEEMERRYMQLIERPR